MPDLNAAMLTKFLESLYEGGWGGGMPSNEDIAKALLKKFDIKSKRAKRSDNG